MFHHQSLSRFKVILFEQGRAKELAETNFHPLTHFMDDSQLYRTICTVYDVANGGLWNSTFHIKLVLGHTAFLQKFVQTFADRFIQFHCSHHTFL